MIIFVLLEKGDSYIHIGEFKGGLKEFADDWHGEEDLDVRVYVVQE